MKVKPPTLSEEEESILERWIMAAYNSTLKEEGWGHLDYIRAALKEILDGRETNNQMSCVRRE